MAYRPPPPRPEVRAWLDAGLAAHRAGDLTRAVDHYRRVLATAPDQPDAHNLLGTALLQGGSPAEARPCLERAAALARDNAQVLANLGQCCIALGDYEAAHDAFRKAARIHPGELQFQLAGASALALAGKLADAENILQRLAKRHPNSAAVWLNLGNVMRDNAKGQEAIDCYAKAVALEPDLADARNALGSALHTTLRLVEAEVQYRECIRLAPDHPHASLNLVSVLMDLGRFEESEAVARALAARAPDDPQIHRLVGSALGFQNRLLEAHACYARAAELDPQSAKCAETLAMSFCETGRTAAGLRWFARALELGAEALTARPLMAAALLADGAVHDGWREYRYRPAATTFRLQNADVPITQTGLVDLDGKAVCVIGEQGLGDELFFLRYAPALAARGARLAYRAGRKIAPLLARLPFLTRIIDSDAPLPSADAYVLAGDLPHALFDFACEAISTRTATRAAFAEVARRCDIRFPPMPQSLRLEPLAERAGRLREQLSRLGPPPYIGVTWRAGIAPEDQRSSHWVLYKAVPLERLGHVLARASGTLVALQRAPAEGEIATLARAAGRDVHDLSALNDDLEDMLALLALIDEYVGVSNTNMHLRACVGKTARVLVPAPAEWRWMRSGASSPWFPGFSIYRQTLQGDWSGALAALERDLSGTPQR